MNYPEKYKELKERLNLLQTTKVDPATGSKIRAIQNMVNKLNQTYKEDCQRQQYKIKTMEEKLSSLDNQITEARETLSTKNENNKMRVLKGRKKLEKIVEKWVKERRENDDKIEHSLDSYLFQLASTKEKVKSGSTIKMKEFLSLETKIQLLEKKIQNEETINKELLQRIYSQFTRQIQELSQILKEQKKQTQIEEERAIESMQRLYRTMQNRLKSLKKQRQNSQKQLIDILEKVIEKLSIELIRQ